MYLSKITKCISVALCALLLCTLMPAGRTEAAMETSGKFVENIIASSVSSDFGTYWDQVALENSANMMVAALTNTTASTGFTVNVSPASGNTGAQIVVPINFDNVPANGISTADMTIIYDATKLEYVSGAAASIVTNAATNFAINKETDGKLKVLFLDYTMSTGYISQSGVFANLTFKVLSSAATSATVSLSSATFGDKNLSNVLATINTGTITINGGATVATPTKTTTVATPTKTTTVATPATTTTSSGFTVSVPSVTGNAGGQIVVPVNFANVPANGISTADMTITYDATKLEYVSGAAGSIVTNAATNFAMNKEKDGTLKALFLDYTMSTGYISTNGIFANLTFKVLGSATATTSLSVASATFGDKNLNNVSATIKSGIITINGSGTVPTPVYTVAPTPTKTVIAPTPTKTTVVATPTKTAATTGFTVNVSAGTGKSGEQIVVPVNFVNVLANGVSTADMTITYDATKLEYVSGAAGSIVTNATTNFAINKEADGKLKVLFLDYTMATEYIKADGVFANLTFKVLTSSAVSTNVSISGSTFGDKNLSNVTATLTAGTIALNGGGAVSTPVVTTLPTPTKPTTAPTPIKTNAPTGFTVYIDSVSGKSGEQIVVPVNFANVSTNGISTADMAIAYDATKLEYVSGEAGSIVTNATTNFAINKEANGKLKVLFLDYTMATEYIKQSGVFANLTFKVITTSAVSTNVSISGATLGDKNLSNVTATIRAGTIALNGGGSVVTPAPTATPVTTVTPAPTATQNPASGNYAVSYSQNSWGTGATVSLTIKNNSSTAANAWTVKFNYSGNQQITNSWNCSYSQNGNSVTITNASYNGTIPAGGSVTVGFNISYTGTNTEPTNFVVNSTSGGSGTTPTTPPSQSQNCSVSYTQNSWGTGATVNVTIKNNGSAPVNGWTVNFTYSGNQQITNAWNCSHSQNGSSVTLKNASYNGTIPAGGSVTVGFNISYSGTNAVPTNFTVN